MFWFLLVSLAIAGPSDTRSFRNSHVSVQRTIEINGRGTSPDVVAALEATYQVRIPAGSYWYDPMSGLWGNWGQPPSGQILPGYDLGPLPSNASGGRSGVVINNRDLHPTEISWLIWLFGYAQPGRYWMDAYGNVGLEGSPYVLVNLPAAASSASGGSSGFHHSGATGATVSSSGGSGYIMFDDGSGVSW